MTKGTEGIPAEKEKYRPADKRLLAFLRKRGQPDPERLAQVERWAAADGLPLIQALEMKGLFREDELAEALAKELRLPLLNLPTVPIDQEAVKLVKESIVSQAIVMPVRAEGGVMILAMANPFDIEVLKTVEFTTGKQVRAAVAPRSHILDAIERYYRFDNALNSLLADVPVASDIAIVSEVAKEDPTSDLRALSRTAEQAPIVKMVNLILSEAVKNKASDIHVEPGPNVTLVRYRINGVLEDTLQVPKWVHSPVVARIKVMAKLDITERRVPQDGSMRIRFKDRLVDLRVSSLPTNYGEKVVMRVLDPSSALYRLDTLGLSERDLRILRLAIQKPEGMILVTGPTGSGKTTTLYAVIQEILSPDLNIVTIENPIEYEVKGVSQVQVNEKQGLTFAGALRSILRQDPDVILLGEIRDKETAEIAFQSAQTGHLVLSTLHTNDSTSSVTRLIDLGIESFLVASSLIAVVAQRLVRTVCERCAEPLVIDDSQRKSLGLKSTAELRQGRGCSNCRKSGFDARSGVYEILEVTDKLRKMIEAKAPETSLRRIAQEEGMTTLLEDAVAKAAAGRTTPEEVMRIVQVEKRGPECPSCSSPVEESFTVCPFCSHQLQLTCASCSAALRGEWKSCPYCGAVPKAEPAPAPAPAAPAPSATPAVTPSTPAEHPTPVGTIDLPQILVVDDNEDLRKVIKMTLERGPHPMKVDGAANGFEALGMVEVNKPHLIILDIMMPGMDGFEVCKRLRANIQTAFIPIIMLTAREDAESKVKGFLAGTDDYLVKPFDRPELLARAQRLLERTYGYRPIEAESAAATGTLQ